MGLFTMAKLVGAILFAIIAWYVSQLIKPLFPEGYDPGRFAEFNALIGLGVGWIVAGSRAGGGWSSGISAGLTAAFALVFWGLLLNCTYEMLRLSLRRQYDGPLEAVIGVFELMFENLMIMLDVQVLVVLFGSAAIAGLVIEFTSRKAR
ncbi:TrgA family protein [Flavimaricola marinus]|uniref:Tellurium resistance protein n=1 Tax=Flavimaricola marinus TaxID=1819565 RepID=A0A238LIT0_9RHOB|nr:TrgA family protein [Flavimaricola marinus]SMY09589.1 hypothetical protein LOM8899_03758 [Flavimaricola marinus]